MVHGMKRTFRATNCVTDLSNEEMVARYRFTNGVDALEEILREYLKRKKRRKHALTVRMMVLITLRILATRAYLYEGTGPSAVLCYGTRRPSVLPSVRREQSLVRSLPLNIFHLGKPFSDS